MVYMGRNLISKTTEGICIWMKREPEVSGPRTPIHYVEKGSVESTHKVPTSHYHTKHRLALRSRRSVD